MAKKKTVKILTDSGFEVESADEFDPSTDELVVEPEEMVVKPKGVDGAKPFVIDKKDFDERAYERVNQTAAVIEEVAKQQERETLLSRSRSGKPNSEVNNDRNSKDP